MVDEPQDQEQSQEENPAQDEGAQPAGPVADEPGDAPTAGPVADEGPSSSQAAGDDPSSTPPAEEASEAELPQDDASAEESAEAPAAEQEQATEAPVAEQEEAKTAAPAEEPKVEKKKDVIPGADLEPIAVEPEARPLSAEEQARREAEEEERRQREAALVGEAEEEPSAASRAPAKIEGDSRFLATGKRKHAIARVTLLPGSGKIEINKRPLEEFFPRPLHQTIAKQPLTTTGYEGNVDVRVRVHGGGVSGQAGAVRHGIARALTEVDPELRGELKRRGFLTRDARVKERRKAGLKKARKRPQFSKR
jgi:small subunit ribosomal protein S9